MRLGLPLGLTTAGLLSACVAPQPAAYYAPASQYSGPGYYGRGYPGPGYSGPRFSAPRYGDPAFGPAPQFLPPQDDPPPMPAAPTLAEPEPPTGPVAVPDLPLVPPEDAPDPVARTAFPASRPATRANVPPPANSVPLTGFRPMRGQQGL